METTKTPVPKTYPKGRRCTICNAYLSIYNPRSRCDHGEPRLQPIRFSEQHDALREMMALMEQDD